MRKQVPKEKIEIKRQQYVGENVAEIEKMSKLKQKKLIYANYVAEKARQGEKIDQLLKNMYSNFIGCDYRIHR